MKYWSCCKRKTSDFNTFLSQEGCTKGAHLWKKKNTVGLPPWQQMIDFCSHLYRKVVVREPSSGVSSNRILSFFLGNQGGPLSLWLAPDGGAGHHFYLRQKCCPRAVLCGCQQHHCERNSCHIIAVCISSCQSNVFLSSCRSTFMLYLKEKKNLSRTLACGE